MASKTKRLIVPAQLTEELVYHDMARAREELGPSYDYMSSSLVPEADIWVNVDHIKQVPVDFKPYLEPHKHQVSEVYVVIGDLTVEVILGGERHEVSGEAGVFIPAGMIHTYRPLRGSGYCVTILRGGKYE
jgi:mannose-6-phosphate isomerase-like protein (cupin superfamily)